MKNYIKIMFSVIIVFFLAVIVFAFVAYRTESSSDNDGANILFLNDIVKNVENNWDKPDKGLDGSYGTEFVILNDADKILFDNRSGEKERLSVETAVKKRYPYRFVTVDGRVAGSVIVIDDGMEKVNAAIVRIIIGLILCGGFLLTSMIIFFIYVEKRIIKPFEKMEEFAGRVAEGRLDAPISMDKDNMFGAFSESFDIMREELAESKKRELALQKKERELVASLSHDLKTPITGIKLTTELLQAKLSLAGAACENEDSEKNITKGELRDIDEKLGNIYKKADQIDVLVSDLFASTLDDLGEFRVSLQDEESDVIDGIIGKYDDKNLVRQDPIPKVIINTDARRLSQVIGNIISNSYKYADTDIDVHYKVADKYLKMTISDHGPGVPKSEIDLITNKFYRGKDWKDGKQDGSGLGLYIAKTLMEKMNGDLIVESEGKGLDVTLLIPLS